MRYRLHELIVVFTVTSVLILALQVSTVHLEGQSDQRTAWGRPILEGIWLDIYATPFERAPELGNRELSTLEERAAVDQARIGLTPAPGRSFQRGPRGTAQDVSGAYNAVYTSVKPAGPRTSLVIDPPNGRLPALTDATKQENAIQREWRLMLMRNTPTCKQQARGCEGGDLGHRHHDGSISHRSTTRHV